MKEQSLGSPTCSVTESAIAAIEERLEMAYAA